MNIDERLCPLCSEVISLNAVKCKHCQSLLSSGIVAKDEKICPLCAEVIKITAIKCKHCYSDLTRDSQVKSDVRAEIIKKQEDSGNAQSKTISGEKRLEGSIDRSQDRISQTYIVLLLLAPFISTFAAIALFIITTVYFPEYAYHATLSQTIESLWSIQLSSLLILLFLALDIKGLERGGVYINGWSRVSILIPPVYLYIRGSKIDEAFQLGWLRSQMPFLAWFVSIGLYSYAESSFLAYLSGY
jgi:hypothetical protein